MRFSRAFREKPYWTGSEGLCALCAELPRQSEITRETTSHTKLKLWSYFLFPLLSIKIDILPEPTLLIVLN